MNFDFIKNFKEFKQLYLFCRDAEELCLQRSYLSCISARKALEYIVKFIYSAKIGLDASEMTIFNITDSDEFINYINDQTVMKSVHIVRKIGNIAAHDGNVTKEDALNCIEQLQYIVGEVFINIGLIDDYPTFAKPEPKQKASAVPADENKIKQQKVEVEKDVVVKYAEKLRHTKFDVKYKRNEDDNKRLFLYACLRESGWGMISVSNTILPNSAATDVILSSGEKIDYILSGADNKPLAIIEFSDNLINARLSAISKADSLSKKYGYTPIVYYTNGYYIYCIDQLGYPPRRVFQFHTVSELELLKQRANSRMLITIPTINNNIIDRDYQKNAVKAACKAFSDNRRHALLVMATGTGKTRVSISLVDVLMKANWVKNVLFLADRKSLVRQAHKSFNKLLPYATTSVYTGSTSDRDSNARIIFSTYQTMINLINEDTREFSIGRFDLIIVDEAHRSIFNKYSSLFHYFDSLVVGLTATPRCEENKSTYEMFNLENAKPDFAYELEEAIKDGYLVGFSKEDKITLLMHRGIKYNDLSEEEKEQFEDTFSNIEDPDFDGTEITGDKFRSKRIINLGTIDVMLSDLMKNGLKINGNDKLGKTIIFASSHREAEEIVKRFNTVYSEYGPDFCKLIDSRVENNLNLIDDFGDRDSMPQIAVSVDMMDTGIDVPDILNLVFFKPVKSKIKFIQMIGRGTRLSPDIYGVGMDKTGFLIFDYYDNCNFFSTHNTWSMVDNGLGEKGVCNTPQTQLINQRKLHILKQLQEKKNLTEFEFNYKQELNDYFLSEIRSLCNDNIEVAANMAYVSKYRTAEIWQNITDDIQEEIEVKIIPLMPSINEPMKTKTFDLLILAVEDEYVKREQEGKDARKIRLGFRSVRSVLNTFMTELLKLKNIPAIVAQEDLIVKMRYGDYLFDNFSLELAEDIRKKLRGLVINVPDNKNYYVVNIKDEPLIKIDDGEIPYSEAAQNYLNTNPPELKKIYNLEMLTDYEKEHLKYIFTRQLGTEFDFDNWSGNMPLLPFLRIQTGISDEALEEKFGSFLNEYTLNETQLEFINQIISYAKENGDITFRDLQNISPFCDHDIADLFEEKIIYIKQLVDGLHKPML